MSKTQPPWSRDEADQIVTSLESSGLSIAEFARQHDIPTHRLYWARRRLRSEPDRSSEQSAFSEVAVVDEPRPRTDQAAIELRLPSGIAVVVTSDFDEVAFRRVLDLLTSC